MVVLDFVSMDPFSVVCETVHYRKLVLATKVSNYIFRIQAHHNVAG